MKLDGTSFTVTGLQRYLGYYTYELYLGVSSSTWC